MDCSILRAAIGNVMGWQSVYNSLLIRIYMVVSSIYVCNL